jgi:hypothetical protein
MFSAEAATTTFSSSQMVLYRVLFSCQLSGGKTESAKWHQRWNLRRGCAFAPPDSLCYTVGMSEPIGITSNIQRLSAEDGPGIRITVFFPARQHPEDYRGQIVRASSYCTGSAGLARLAQDEVVAWMEHTV